MLLLAGALFSIVATRFDMTSVGIFNLKTVL
jgi:hypothetical protein